MSGGGTGRYDIGPPDATLSIRDAFTILQSNREERKKRRIDIDSMTGTRTIERLQTCGMRRWNSDGTFLPPIEFKQLVEDTQNPWTVAELYDHSKRCRKLSTQHLHCDTYGCPGVFACDDHGQGMYQDKVCHVCGEESISGIRDMAR